MVVLKGAIMWMVRRLGRRRGPPVQIVLYERPGCHLCEEAEELLRRLAPRFPMQLRRVDITTDRELLRRYDIRIPVIQVGGGLELEAPITRGKLERALQAAPSGSKGRLGG
jgi:glutaredoxin